MPKILYCHDFEFAIDELSNIYTAVGMPEKYFDRFFDAGATNVTILSRFFEINSQEIPAGFKLITSNRIGFAPVLTRGYRSFINPTAVLNLYRALKAHDLTVISTPSVNGSMISLLQLFTRSNYVTEVASDKNMFNSKGVFGVFFGLIIAPIMKWSIYYANGATFVTQGLKHRYRNRNSCTIVGSNVIIKKHAFKARCHNDGNRIRLLFCGALSKRKGVPLLINLVEDLVHQRGLNVSLDLLGGHADFDVDSKIKQLNLEGHVFRHGLKDREEVFEFMDKATIYIQPSEAEGVPRATIEAMSRGLPVISSDLEGFTEILDERATIDTKNPTVFFDRVFSILSDSNFIDRQARRNLEYSRKFGYDRLHTSRVKFYRTLLESLSLSVDPT